MAAQSFGTFTKDGETRVADTPTRAVILKARGWREVTGDATPSDVPARSGKGSSRDDWAAYARKHKVEVADTDTRDDIIGALVASDVPVE